MERILKILVTGIFVFLLILWIATVFNTCNKDKKADVANSELVADTLDESGDIDLTEDIFDEDSSEVKSKISSKLGENNSETSDENLDDFIDYTGDSKEKPVKSKAAKSTTPKAKQTPKPVASSHGKYLVVAGSYLVEDNARKMKKRLYNLGYNSEIVNFDLSQYYTVIAGRYNSRSDAQNTVNILKRNGIDSYVHKRKK
ncbi:MAG TPA: hypothetical protein ENK91_05890 [Bacteroidetes bacterium]|nr:hypothetical protein [Bacteroidota bacterium]